MEKTLPESLSTPDYDETRILEDIRQALRGIIDPETGLDVMRMGLVRHTELHRKEAGYEAILTFRPSSPVCPMAFKLAWDMQQCVRSVPGVQAVEIKVENYNRASELEAILKEEGIR